MSQEVLESMQDEQKQLFLRNKFGTQSSFQKKFETDLFSICTEKDKWNKKFKNSLIEFLFNRNILESKNVDLKNLRIGN